MQFFPQSGNVGIDDIRAWIEVHVPDLVVKLASRDCLAGAEHEVFQQLELHGCEAYVLALARHSARKAIQREISRAGLFAHAGASAAPPDEGPYARAKLLVRNGLDDVIIGAGVETANDRFCVGAPGVQKYGSWASVPPQLLEDLKTVPVSQLQIENYSVVVVDERQRPCLLARGRHVHGVRFVAEYTGDELQYCSIVIND